MEKKKMIRFTIAITITVFGLITLFMSSSVIFDLFGIRAKEGNYVLFVVVANFITSMLYLFAAFGFVKKAKWTAKLLYISLAVLIAAFTGLLIHISTGGIYETKTIGAMVFRIALTIVFVVSANFMRKKN